MFTGFNAAGIIDRFAGQASRFARNPNMIFLAEVRIRDYGNHDAFPDDHPYWLRDAEGNIVYEDSYGWRMIDFANPAVQDIIVGQALAISRCGLYDGVFFDHWDDHHSTVGDYIPNDIAQRARDNIIRRIREGTRPDFLIMGNTNFRIIPARARTLTVDLWKLCYPETGMERKYNFVLYGKRCIGWKPT